MVTLTPQTGNTFPKALTGANTASDGSGTLVTIVTASKNGTVVNQVTFRNAQASQAASSDMLGKVFLTDESGANPRIIAEVLIPTKTRAATVLGAVASINFTPPIVMVEGQLLKSCISVHAGDQDNTVVTAIAADY